MSKLKSKKKGSIKHFDVDISLYKAIVNVVISDDWTEASRVLNLPFLDDDICVDERATGFIIQKNGYITMFFKDSDLHLSTIAHEASHATFYILDSTGIKICTDNHEAFSYLQDFIVRECLSALGIKDQIVINSKE